MRLLAATFLWLAALQLSAATLNLDIDNIEWRSGSVQGYNVFDSTEYSQTFYFNVRHTGDATSYFITFSGLEQAQSRKLSHGGEEVDYHLLSSPTRGAVLKDLPDASANEVLSGFFPEGEQNAQLSFVINIPAMQIRSPGRYIDRIKVSLYEGTLQDYKLRDQKNISISTIVEDVAEVSIVEPGGVFDKSSSSKNANFGILQKGKTLSYDVRVRTNRGYRINVESENLGVLKSNDPSLTDNIPYEIRFSGQSVNLRGRASGVVQDPQKTNANGRPHRIEIVIGDLGNAAQGEYKDNLLIEIVTE